MSPVYPTPEWIKEPPPPEVPYNSKKALKDLDGIAYALQLFLASQMLEAEEYCNKSDPKKCVVSSMCRWLILQCPQGAHLFRHRFRTYPSRERFDVI